MFQYCWPLELTSHKRGFLVVCFWYKQRKCSISKDCMLWKFYFFIFLFFLLGYNVTAKYFLIVFNYMPGNLAHSLRGVSNTHLCDVAICLYFWYSKSLFRILRCVWTCFSLCKKIVSKIILSTKISFKWEKQLFVRGEKIKQRTV